MKKGIIFFDLDGTLTFKNTADTLGRAIGKEKEIRELEGMLGNGMSDAEWVRRVGMFVAEHPEYRLLENFWSIFENIEFIEGIDRTLDLLRREYVCGVVTSGIGEFARLMKLDPYRLDFGYGCSIEVDHTLTAVKRFGPPVVTKDEKARFVRKKCRELGIESRKCYAVGNSEEDVPMLQAVGTSIAVNSDDSLGADHHIPKFDDLGLILRYIH